MVLVGIFPGPSLSQWLHRLCSRKQAAVDRVYNRLRGDLPTSKEAPIQALDRVLAALHTVKLKIDVTSSVVVEGNVHYMAILLLALGAHVIFELFDPGVAFFSVVKEA